MSRIRSKDTRIEVQLREIVREALGPRWRIILNVSQLPGKPDIVVPGLRLVVLADGCFFHGCPLHGRVPASNRAYWQAKLTRTSSRDQQQRCALRSMGYAVWRFWEHDLEGGAVDRTLAVLKRRVAKMLCDGRGGQNRRMARRK